MQDYQFAPSPNVDAISDKYSSSATYAVGDYCIHDDRLYKCSTAINTAEAWNSAHWTETDVASEITSLSNNVANIGTYKTGTNASSLSVPTGILTTICTIALTAGTWIVTGGFQLGSSAQGKLCYGCISNSTPSVISGTTVRFDGNSGGGYNGTTIIQLSGSANYLLRVYQSSGSSISATNVSMRAVRIA